MSQHFGRARRDIDDKLQQRFETDVKRAASHNVRSDLPRLIQATMLPPYGATYVSPTIEQVLHAADNGVNLHPCDTLVHNNGIPDKIQLALNISHRLSTASATLPDLYDQLRGPIASHLPLNV